MSNIVAFISYSHDSDEHRASALRLSERLRADGIDTGLDQYVNGTPTEGWPRWMLNQLDAAQFVLVVCTETYYRRFRGHEVPGKGKGGDWEGAIITQEIYDSRSTARKFVPVLFTPEDEKFIPEPLRAVTHYTLTSESAYCNLYDALLGQSGVEPGPVGSLKPRQRATGTPLTFADSPIELRAKADISRIDRYAPAQLIGRETETKVLSKAWDQAVRGEKKRPHVFTLVALGGEGKTSLVAKWTADLAHQDWPGCDAVFAWSFYSQGMQEQAAASSDVFLKEALIFFGDQDMAGSAQGAIDKARRLAQLVGERRALLILDGLEPLQYSPISPMPGELKDQGLKALLKGLAANNQGLCVVTTRYSIPDLRVYQESTAPEMKLTRLSGEAGVALLRLLGVKGTQQEFETLVEDVKGHALTLNLLGTYLHDAHAGDIRKRDLVKLEEADAEEHGGHAFRAMDAYVQWFEIGSKDEVENKKGQRALALLRLLGLFDRPATADCLFSLLKAPAISGLTSALVGLREPQVNVVFTRLETAKLLTVNRDKTGTLLSLDTHPLIREYFARQLLTQNPGVWRAAHRRLYKHLCATTPNTPEPRLEHLQPLYQAVAHGCQAGLQQEACVKVYINRILRGPQDYSLRIVGAIASDLGAITCFFEEPWSRPSPALTIECQAFLLSTAAYCLRSLGRLTEALVPMRNSLTISVQANISKEAAARAGALSDLELTLGEVENAVRHAEQALTFAERRNDWTQKVLQRTVYAQALHQAGRRPQAETLFCEAEILQAENCADPLLYAVQGSRYCDLLLDAAERAAWQRILESEGYQPAVLSILPERGHRANKQSDIQDRWAFEVLACRKVAQRAAQTLNWVKRTNWLVDIALDHLTLGRVALYEAILTSSLLTPCGAAFEEAIDGLRHAAAQTEMPRALASRACFWFLEGKCTGPESAQSDLDEAWELTERGPMPLFLADIHLHRARLFWQSGASGRQYPWESPQKDLAEARRLIEKHGYWRRKEELEDAESAILTKT